MLAAWLGFLISLATILIISRKHLVLALFIGALVLGLFTLPIGVLLERTIYTATDLSVVLLALAMGLIPILGSIMKESGQIDSLVSNLRLPTRYMLPFSAALMGLLPMPGGALLSAPLLEKAGPRIDGSLNAVINNWFRHLFILIYPLSPALIVAAQISGIDVYRSILYLLPGFALALILGFIFYLRPIHGQGRHSDRFSWIGLFLPLLVILSAPIVDFTLRRLFALENEATLAGVATGLTLSVLLSRSKPSLRRIIIESRPWNFALIIIGMFLYLHIFQASDIGSLIADLPLPPLMLAVTGGFLLAMFTGRVQLPASIILPIYLASIGKITPVAFAVIYTSTYFGYIISPVHPCLVVTCEYFGIPVKGMISKLALPTIIIFLTVLLVAFVIS